MKKTITVICSILLVAFLLVPMAYEATDGGTRQYVAPLYSVTKQNSIHTQDGVNGYISGTIVRVLFFEVYNDAVFIPMESSPAEAGVYNKV